jgi:hypothetical protein
MFDILDAGSLARFLTHAKIVPGSRRGWVGALR